MIYNLNEINKKDIGIVGGKAGNLGKLIKYGFNVPKGFVCTDLEDEEEIFDYFSKLKLERVAVRSSAICEDGKNNSYAGQFETFLNVSKSNLINSIKRCFNSNKADNIQGYIAERNIRKDNTKVSVIIQKMIEGNISGVIFTINPVTEENEMIIEFVCGLGEKLVQGEETPTQIIINRNTLEIKNKIGKNINNITNTEINELIKIGTYIEKIFQYPQDIEWTIKNGKIFILQARNITNIKRTTLYF